MLPQKQYKNEIRTNTYTFYASFMPVFVFTALFFVDTMPVPVDDENRKQAILLMNKAVSRYSVRRQA
jgi:hypothetical protein